jgi:SAM-dependent methyltransferase
VSTYSLALSEGELDRYRIMAAAAADDEGPWWAAAGIVPGAHVADVGCGPGAILAELARAVGPGGRVTGVDGDPAAVGHARDAVASSPQATAVVGRADATGLRPASVDVAMCRHVLAHNGGREPAIVAHLVDLVRPGGAVYLVDVDGTAVRLVPDDPDLDIGPRYQEFHAGLGNDLSVGLQLGRLLEEAGTVVERFSCLAPVLRPPPGIRPPQWAAREAMVTAGVLAADDVERWRRAFERMDAQTTRPWMFVPMFVAVGRVPV